MPHYVTLLQPCISDASFSHISCQIVTSNLNSYPCVPVYFLPFAHHSYQLRKYVSNFKCCLKVPLPNKKFELIL